MRNIMIFEKYKELEREEDDREKSPDSKVANPDQYFDSGEEGKAVVRNLVGKTAKKKLSAMQRMKVLGLLPKDTSIVESPFDVVGLFEKWVVLCFM